MVKIDLHNHTNSSYDCLLSPRKLIRIAYSRGIHVLAITDHESVKNLKKATLEAKDRILLIPGYEFKTTHGDILALFMNTLPQTRDYFEVIEFIKNQNGLSVFAHPYNSSSIKYRSNRNVLSNADLIEGLNGRLTYGENLQAIKIAKKINKSITAGSDAHVMAGIGCSYLETEESIENIDQVREYLFSSAKKGFYRKTHWFWENYSQLIKYTKQKTFRMYPSLIHNFLIQIKGEFF